MEPDCLDSLASRETSDPTDRKVPLVLLVAKATLEQRVSEAPRERPDSLDRLDRKEISAELDLLDSKDLRDRVGLLVHPVIWASPVLRVSPELQDLPALMAFRDQWVRYTQCIMVFYSYFNFI